MDDSPKDLEPKAPPSTKIPTPTESQEGDPDWVEVRESWVGEPNGPISVAPYVAAVLPPPSPNVDASAEALLGDARLQKPRSVPPPLPPSAWPAATMSAAASEAFAIAAARAPDTRGAMIERLDAGDFDGALRAAECVLRAHPTDAEAVRSRELARAELRRVYLARLGDMARAPSLVADGTLLRMIDVDLHAGIVLARVDGKTSLDDIVLHAGTPELDALRILSELVLSGVLAFEA